jgi:hypothetical protein
LLARLLKIARTVNTETILSLLRLRAAEESDPRGDVIRWDEREHAAQEALRLAGQPHGSDKEDAVSESQWRFLIARADVLRTRAVEVVGEIPSFGNLGTWGRSICLIALTLGFASHGAGLSRSFDLLAGPFLLLIVWNAVVYVMLIYRMFRKSPASSQSGVIKMYLEKRINGLFGDVSQNKARAAFAQSVQSWLRSWTTPTLVSWFHAGSACFTLGLLAAIYARGVNTGYVAAWESTWFDPQGVASVLHPLLGPASWISGIPLPDSIDGWRQLQRVAGHEGVSARPWIHLYAITMILWVVVPRCFLSMASYLRATRLRDAPPAWNAKDSYLRRILSLARQGDDIGIAILPFDWKQPDAMNTGTYRDAIERLVRETWGQGGRARWLNSVSYGDEETVWEDVWSEALHCDGALILFDLGATPEEEVHGILLEEVLKRYASGRGGILIALEAVHFSSARFDSQLKLWHDFAKRRKCSVLPLEKGGIRDQSISPTSLVNRPL